MIARWVFRRWDVGVSEDAILPQSPSGLSRVCNARRVLGSLAMFIATNRSVFLLYCLPARRIGGWGVR